MVGGYVRKCVVLRISTRVEDLLHWQRGNSREFVSVSQFIQVISIHYIVLNEKIGPPHIILVSDFQRLLGEQSIPIDLFFVLSRKSLSKRLGFSVFAIA